MLSYVTRERLADRTTTLTALMLAAGVRVRHRDTLLWGIPLFLTVNTGERLAIILAFIISYAVSQNSRAGVQDVLGAVSPRPVWRCLVATSSRLSSRALRQWPRLSQMIGSPSTSPSWSRVLAKFCGCGALLSVTAHTSSATSAPGPATPLFRRVPGTCRHHDQVPLALRASGALRSGPGFHAARCGRGG
jgi:hypothetical protein